MCTGFVLLASGCIIKYYDVEQYLITVRALRHSFNGQLVRPYALKYDGVIKYVNLVPYANVHVVQVAWTFSCFFECSEGLEDGDYGVFVASYGRTGWILVFVL